MMGPDITHWHGTYEIAKHFYVKFIPELEELVERGNKSGDADKQAAAKALAEGIEKTLNSNNHKWFLNKLDPEEIEKRKARQAEFKSRYE